MKTLRLLIACGLIASMASCGNSGQNQDTDGSDSLFIDSTANDSATWGDTTPTTDSLASPSFP
ncbi:hypothetical protein JHJ32_16475 [Parapedobacter sp. ISTM3]|uniref:Uncharacterized protein n=1 Tax=Parapedobacter luteus TaxID=623280 RepID=A0A1T5EUP4_9SPHI|nr:MULTISPECIES: hypothetical protein [Parapedobacter]MBK1441596.1 hypothetical protein [Parapedobacter sp. ISTM3]SKB87692.1 hypothetical protein SAMN05660226_03576 [Parapedobacter luteus]